MQEEGVLFSTLGEGVVTDSSQKPCGCACFCVEGMQAQVQVIWV